jgi:hypothetical protein
MVSASRNKRGRLSEELLVVAMVRWRYGHAYAGYRRSFCDRSLWCAGGPLTVIAEMAGTVTSVVESAEWIVLRRRVRRGFMGRI